MFNNFYSHKNGAKISPSTGPRPASSIPNQQASWRVIFGGLLATERQDILSFCRDEIASFMLQILKP